MATRTLIRRRPRILTPAIEQGAISYAPTNPVADILTQVAYVFFAILEGMLIARFVMRLAGANPFNDIVAWIYNATSMFVLPFEAMFPSAATDSSVLEVSTLVAMVAYLFIFYLAVALFRLFIPAEEVINPDGDYDAAR